MSRPAIRRASSSPDDGAGLGDGAADDGAADDGAADGGAEADGDPVAGEGADAPAEGEPDDAGGSELDPLGADGVADGAGEQAARTAAIPAPASPRNTRRRGIGRPAAGEALAGGRCCTGAAYRERPRGLRAQLARRQYIVPL